MKPGDTFAIVGLGLMGGSYAMGLTKKGYRVVAIDPDEAALQYALEQGIIDAGATTGADLLPGADYIVLGMYPADIVPWLRENAKRLKPGAFITDLAGVKSCFVHQAQALLPNNEFIASHPMAGREKSGVQNATETMFYGANFLIVPTEKNTPEGKGFAFALASTLGFGRITTLTPEEHDSMIGYVSQLTHAIAVSLMNANGDERLPEVTGDSFRDLTRIADINEELWSELFLANKPFLVEEIDGFIATLTDLRSRVQNEDKEGLKALMRSSAVRRRSFGKKV